MMIHRMFPLIALLATPATAEVVSMAPMPMDDLWVEVPVDATFTPGPPTYDDIVAMANLDDDPAVISDREREMIALLSQVLGSAPITN
ncbi:hypothetical protein SAMN05444339_101750 [Loktanella atrilutea]|uniref:Uncharacterized protein n=2 Tax=Loktanella atrilutea TaxID=366533 RepID=A0A1M4UJ07_LOKAT|nr:hypothetical protein SAMN05444339_101750 [Loktanella atrilutea]